MAEVKTGFFEESPGVKSMTRVVMLLLALGALSVSAVVCVYVIRADPPEAAVITACAAVLATLVVNGVVAISKRNGGTEVDMSANHAGTDA